MTERCALIEGPVWADTKFYGRWLLAASKANELWTEALSNRRFNKRVDRLLVTYIPDFNIAATVLLSRLEQNLASLVVDLDGEGEPEEFAMMVGMGFFVLTGERYQMVIPTRLTLTKEGDGRCARIGKNRRSRIHPASRTLHCHNAVHGSQGMANP